MARIYGYWDDELNTFVPSGGGAPQQQGAMPIAGNQGSYSVPYSNAPRYGQRFYGPGGMPTDIAVGSQFAAPGRRIGVRYNYQPRYTGNGYAPRGYNTNMNYGPWYGQQSYATYPPYAPYQPRYEWMPGSNGQPVAVRLGEYQREQPVAHETMFNSQGVPVQVPIYAPMNNSARPVRMGTDIEGRPYGSANVNYQAAFPQQQQTRNVQRLSQTSKTPPQGLTYQQAMGINRAYMNTDYGDEGLAQEQAQVQTQAPVETDSREALIQAEFQRRKENQDIAVSQGNLTPLSDEDLMAQAVKTVDARLNRENISVTSSLGGGRAEEILSRSR